MKKALYTWNWVGDGFNQTYAVNKVEALKQAKKIWSTAKVELSTLKRHSKASAELYWKNFPSID
jgi:hypothetical protein